MDTLIYILLGLTSVVGLAFIVERAPGVALAQGRAAGNHRVACRLQSRDDVKTLCRVCEQKPSPLGRLLLLAAGPSRLAEGGQRGRVADRRPP